MNRTLMGNRLLGLTIALLASGNAASWAADPPTSSGAPNPFRAVLEGNLQTPSNDPPRLTPPAAPTAPADARRLSDQALRGARQALAVGDLPRAQQLLDKAEQLHVAYDSQGDSPQRVAESVGELAKLTALKASEHGRVAWRQNYSKFLVAQAQALVTWNELDNAERAANEALQLSGGSDNSGGRDKARDLLETIAQAKQASQSPVKTAGDDLAAKAAATAVAESAEDQVTRATAEEPTPLVASLINRAPQRVAQAPMPLPAVEDSEAVSPLPTDALSLMQQGEEALRRGERGAALRMFRAAFDKRAELDVLSQQRLQGHLQMLSAVDQSAVGAPPAPGEPPAAGDANLIDSADASQKVLVKQMWTDVSKRQAEATRLRESDPQKSLAILTEARELVAKSSLEESMKQQLNGRIALSEGATQQYINEHKAELDLAQQNKSVLDGVEREQAVKLEVQQRIATDVDQFNKLIDENRYAEAELIATRLYEMAPTDMVVQQVWRQGKLIRRERLNRDIIDGSENGVASTNLGIRQTAALALEHTDKPIDYGTWSDLTKGRTTSSERNSRRSIKELEIEQKLKTPVLPQYSETPLTEVVEGLAELAGINIYLDPRGLSQEGVRTDASVTLNLRQEVSLKSALTLILEPLHLTYTIKDEVLKITSEQIRDGEVFPLTYNVADLVIPIPNFVPTNNMGLQGLINDAYAAMGYGPSGGIAGPIALAAGNRRGQAGPGTDGNVLAQQFGAGGGGSGAAGSIPFANGPGGAGGAAQADFDSLIDLIVTTIEHDSWMENGTGQGEIQPFPTNLSLVISQTQRVHEQIADLLEQLRRLQDLQVTIEVRFIRLTDNFFEQIGVDFDFNIEDSTGISTIGGVNNALTPGSSFEPRRASATVGLDPAPGGGDFPAFSVDLDIPFRQDSFSLATPTFGAPAQVGSFGMAVLSDIEAYFLINASQGNRRANVLNAPKVTLFNGQQGIVVDSAFVPFVISVIPVVGEFAAAQQPVIVVLSEGTMLTVQAVVSDDRRYVRLTLVPFFSQIGEVREFTFEGSETSSSSSDTSDADQDGTNEADNNAQTTVRSGTTVQLPTFEVISVSTTVSVPDGGTVLLGGIKRLREGRNEFGVPLLSKIPYLDRLFRNVGIGRETDSLMMMVTPHIIIQEEEEERLGISTE